jgi:hypothetical protein
MLPIINECFESVTWASPGAFAFAAADSTFAHVLPPPDMQDDPAKYDQPCYANKNENDSYTLVSGAPRPAASFPSVADGIHTLPFLSRDDLPRLDKRLQMIDQLSRHGLIQVHLVRVNAQPYQPVNLVGNFLQATWLIQNVPKSHNGIPVSKL